MGRLLAMQVFERVADEGGFSAAGRALDISPPVVPTAPRRPWKRVWNIINPSKGLIEAV